MSENEKTPKLVTYKSLGDDALIELNIEMVKQLLTRPTRSGAMPSQADVIRFIKLCQSRRLNPWVGDAFLVGYDSQDGPQFSLITAVQAIHKRAELSPQYDGIESGLILSTPDGTIESSTLQICPPKRQLFGAWAKVWRKDVSHPFEAMVKLNSYSSGRSRWKVDPDGMILKCAESAALRKAFPSQIGGLFSQEEMQQMPQARNEESIGSVQQLAEQLKLITPKVGSIKIASEDPEPELKRTKPGIHEGSLGPSEDVEEPTPETPQEKELPPELAAIDRGEEPAKRKSGRRPKNAGDEKSIFEKSDVPF